MQSQRLQTISVHRNRQVLGVNEANCSVEFTEVTWDLVVDLLETSPLQTEKAKKISDRMWAFTAALRIFLEAV